MYRFASLGWNSYALEQDLGTTYSYQLMSTTMLAVAVLDIATLGQGLVGKQALGDSFNAMLQAMAARHAAKKLGSSLTPNVGVGLFVLTWGKDIAKQTNKALKRPFLNTSLRALRKTEGDGKVFGEMLAKYAAVRPAYTAQERVLLDGLFSTMATHGAKPLGHVPTLVTIPRASMADVNLVKFTVETRTAFKQTFQNLRMPNSWREEGARWVSNCVFISPANRPVSAMPFYAGAVKK